MALAMRSRVWLAITLALLIVPAMSFAQSITFRTATLQPLPDQDDQPSAMAVGDLNNDQQPDVVVANYLSHTVSVFLGAADGSLSLVGDFPAGGTGRCILIKDFDGDTIPDLLVSWEESDNLFFLHGLGDGTFSTPVAIDSGHDPVRIAAGDLDGDGKLDLAVALSAAAEGNGQVSILRGHGDGTFEPPQTIVLDVGSEGVVMHDFDGDGLADLAVSNSGPGTISMLHNLGNGMFATPVSVPVGGGTGPLALADLDEDGRLDLVAANAVDDTIAVLRSHGDGTFDAPAIFATGGSQPSDLALVDVNGDGHLDAVVSNRFSDSVSVLLGVGDGWFDAPRNFVPDASPLAVAVLNLNGDASADILTLSKGPGGAEPSLAELFGDGAGHFEAVEQLPAAGSGTAVAVADFNEDAVADAVIAVAQPRGIEIFFGAAHAGDVPSRFVATDRRPAAGTAALAVADFDGDGHADLVMATTTASLTVLFGVGDGSFAPAASVPLSVAATAVGAGDFDADGDPDLVLLLAGTPGSFVVLRNDGGRQFSSLEPVPLTGRPTSLAVSDFDGDHKLDLAITDVDAGRVLLALGLGNNTFNAAGPIATGLMPSFLVASDADANGSEDLLALDAGLRTVRILTNDGSGHFVVGTARPAGTLATMITPRDLTGDGRPEFLIADRANGVGVATNTTRFQIVSSVRSSSFAAAVASADFDGDGRYDVMVTGLTTCRLINTSPVGDTPMLRGDGNGDGGISVADLMALSRELDDGEGTRVDDVGRGAYAAHPGVDADGDGVVTRRDERAMIRRMMHRPTP